MCYSHLHPPTHPPSIYLPTYPSTFQPTNILNMYLPNPTYMVATPIDPQKLTMMRKEYNEGIAWSLVLFIQTNKLRGQY